MGVGRGDLGKGGVCVSDGQFLPSYMMDAGIVFLDPPPLLTPSKSISCRVKERKEEGGLAVGRCCVFDKDVYYYFFGFSSSFSQNGREIKRGDQIPLSRNSNPHPKNSFLRTQFCLNCRTPSYIETFLRGAKRNCGEENMLFSLLLRFATHEKSFEGEANMCVTPKSRRKRGWKKERRVRTYIAFLTFSSPFLPFFARLKCQSLDGKKRKRRKLSFSRLHLPHLLKGVLLCARNRLLSIQFANTSSDSHMHAKEKKGSKR